MKISEGDGNIYILLYLKYLSKTTAKRILFSYVTAAVCALALGITIAFTGVLEGFNQLTTTTASTPSSADHANSHTPRFLNAEASTMPMLAIDYAVLDVERDGDASAGPLVVKVYPDWLDRHCESCYRIDYNAYLVGKAGIAWKTGQPLDVQGAQRMVVWAKGEYGGEQVRFLILGKQIGSPSSTTDENLFDNIEFVSKSETVTLSSNFQMYHIDIPNVDTTNFNDITHLVALEIEGGDRARPTVIYLSGFIFDSSTPSNQYVLENEEIAS